MSPGRSATSPIVFFGTPEFAVASLEALLSSGRTVSLVVTQPDRPAGRGLKTTPPAVKLFVQAHDLALLQPKKIKDPAFHKDLRRCEAQIFVVAAYGRILPREILEIPTMVLNVHGSLLPRWRGAAPIERAILAGDTETGISIMRLVEEMDAGDVLWKVSTPIPPEATSGEMYELLAGQGARALIEGLDLLDKGGGTFEPQRAADVTFAPPIRPEEARISWERPAAELHNHVRGFSPHPGAYTLTGKERIKIFAAREGGPTSVPHAPSGSPHAEKGRLFVACGSGWLELLELQREGRKRQSASSFLQGFRLDDGRWG